MPARVGIFFGSTTYGAHIIAEKLQVALGLDLADIHNIGRSEAENLLQYHYLILGTSTWGDGDIQPAWNKFLPTLRSLDLTGRMVALYGLGDQETYPDTFVSGLGLLYEAAVETGATIAGSWSPDGYTFDSSRALRNGRFVGLVIDKINQASLTNERVARWVEELKQSWDLTL